MVISVNIGLPPTEEKVSQEESLNTQRNLWVDLKKMSSVLEKGWSLGSESPGSLYPSPLSGSDPLGKTLHFVRIISNSKVPDSRQLIADRETHFLFFANCKLEGTKQAQS